MKFQHIQNIREYALHTLITALIILSITSCSSSPNTDTVFDATTGKHVANWMTKHGPAYLTDQTICFDCHGTDLLGGISKVSCYSASFNGTSCHSNGPGHSNPTAWADPAVHGVSAKAFPNPAAMAGFAVCEICHGATFIGNTYSPSCNSCHGGALAPHPVSWITSTGTTTYTHQNTNPYNAAVCAQCHLNGNLSPIAKPSPPAPPGTPVSCFNNTLCHASIHPLGWSAAAAHGVAAKAAPNVTAVQGFSTCQTCHANDFSGGTSFTSCNSCHGGTVPLPHPQAWRPDSTYRHTNTNGANAGVCALCHTNGANSPIRPPSPPAPAGTAPGCTNGTLCHYSL